MDVCYYLIMATHGNHCAAAWSAVKQFTQFFVSFPVEGTTVCVHVTPRGAKSTRRNTPSANRWLSQLGDIINHRSVVVCTQRRSIRCCLYSKCAEVPWSRCRRSNYCFYCKTQEHNNWLENFSPCTDRLHDSIIALKMSEILSPVLHALYLFTSVNLWQWFIPSPWPVLWFVSSLFACVIVSKPKLVFHYCSYSRQYLPRASSKIRSNLINMHICISRMVGLYIILYIYNYISHTLIWYRCVCVSIS